MEYTFRLATTDDAPAIWEILQGAIARRKADGSRQWQDGYPNPDVVKADIDKQIGYVLIVNGTVAGYCAVLINDEPAYDDIDGKWLTDDDFVVYHRVAISEQFLGVGLAQKMLGYIEGYALQNNIKSLKVDTNFDNPGMLKILDKLGYTYCGEVYFRGSARKAFEKIV
ncbi:GNAT family N-acetyltransferase [Flavobacterium sp. RHBU_3]|uniref:GNAT family N-acetyltransferase n=1 Tax=Flavobacterium sp. RHBU_3 TaxID=3391184 RepID=UPI003984BC88